MTIKMEFQQNLKKSNESMKLRTNNIDTYSSCSMSSKSSPEGKSSNFG